MGRLLFEITEERHNLKGVLVRRPQGNVVHLEPQPDEHPLLILALLQEALNQISPHLQNCDAIGDPKYRHCVAFVVIEPIDFERRAFIVSELHDVVRSPIGNFDIDAFDAKKVRVALKLPYDPAAVQEVPESPPSLGEFAFA